jgi:glycosyltransferase involved in cell wall biosynthesis
MDWAEIEGTIRKRYFQEAECMKQADLLFVLNEKTKENAVQHFGVSEEKICRIRNGVNTNLYRPLSKVEKQQTKEKLGLSGRKVIVQVGSVCENKGQIRSLSYLLPLMKRDPAVTYVFAGGIVDMSYYQQLQQWVHDNNAAEQVRYCGVLQPGEELNALYNTAHISMLFSGYDAFPLVTVESAAAGVPMLTGENIPVFLDESVSYIPSENVTDKIESLLYSDEEEYAELCRRVRENAVRNYSWEKVAEVYLTQFKAKGC